MNEAISDNRVDNRVLKMWARFSGLPMGRFVFSIQSAPPVSSACLYLRSVILHDETGGTDCKC